MEDLLSVVHKLLEKECTSGCKCDDQRKFLRAFIEEFDNTDEVDVKKAVERARELKEFGSVSDLKRFDEKRRDQFVDILNTVINKEECLKLDDFLVIELEELRDKLKSKMFGGQPSPSKMSPELEER